MITAVAGTHYLLASWNDYLLTFMPNKVHERKDYYE